MKTILNVQSLLWLALLLALAGSLKHLAAIFASIDGDVPMGWLQAVAIDAGLFALAYSIKVRKVARRSVRVLWLGVALFSTISIYGNYAYGMLATSGSLPAWIVASRPIVLAASLPVLVLYLAELVSDDRQHANAIAERQAKKAAKRGGKAVQIEAGTANLAGINATAQEAKAANIARLAGILAADPQATNTELAGRLGVSRGTVRNYKLELAESGNGRV